MDLTKDKLRKYLEYASTDEARAVLFVKEQLNKSAGHWIDVIDCESYENYDSNVIEFKFVTCGLYKRKIKPTYPPKLNFTVNGKFDEREYYLSVRAITWETANKDISQQKNKGIKGDIYEIRGVKYNKNRGKFIKEPPWLNDPAWKNVDIYSLRGTDRSYVQQFLAPPDWRYEIKSIRKITNLKK